MTAIGPTGLERLALRLSGEGDLDPIVGLRGLIANMVPSFRPVAQAATALVATSCLMTAILVPILTGFGAKRMGHVTAEEAEAESYREGVEPI
ncbi:2-keto-3-deoxygluconate permease [Bradyrhizobium genosp. L]|uniref:2-keto-3-deoxygluconate permease n=1 Tax=Bradyrhizobium genosp. L TaxID=83637 RepID=UPI0018A24CB9|nr:2-keto-3-deoxygluconate permease [Bradyrhizobium genosp. L]QPF81847.1 2-keto-3-deoxygluconate permease [Bradyrhizobium genosp. L]